MSTTVLTAAPTNVPPTTRPRSRIDMPPLQSRGAPKKFSGRSHDVTKFINHCSKLFTQNNVFSDVEKVECMAEYCSRNVLHILEGMKNYATPDWAILCTDMEHMFDADKDLQRHRPTDLRKLAEKWRKKPIKTMSTWRKYLRQYTTIAGWLVQQKLIDETESSRYLWHGIHSRLRHTIENRLLAKDPKRDMTVPFTQDDIVSVVDAMFKRGRFDADIDSSESDSEDTELESDSDSSESDISDSDDELHYKKKKKKSKTSRSKPATKKKVAHTRESQVPGIVHKPATATPTDNSGDVGDLVKRLSKMSLDDQEYNYLYYKATSLDPLVARCIRAPNLTITSAPLPPLPPNNFRNNRYIAPPNQLGPNPNANQPQMQPGDRSCWGCGEKGHGLWECPIMAEPIGKGDLKRGERGIEWKDGSLLRRFNQQGETLHHAYIRQRAERLGPQAAVAQSNLTYATMVPADCNQGTNKDPILPVFVQSTTSDDELTRIFAVTRSSDKVQRAVPYQVPQGNNRPNTRAQVKRTGAELEGIPNSVKATEKSVEARIKMEAVDPAPIPVQHPVDQIDHRVDFSREDTIMEDDEPIEQDTEQVLKTANQPPKLSKRAGPRKSAVSAYVNHQDILNQMLNGKLDISNGQALAISPMLANALIEVLRLKNSGRESAVSNFVGEVSDVCQNDDIVPNSETPVLLSATNPNSIVAATFITRDRQRLIRLQVVINGKMVIAIVDTGSMLNVVSRAAWRTYMSHHSMDITRHINMGDANGGQAQLRGYLKDVSMVMGGVETTASFWVGDKVPFEVLLGRPWQRGNYVSIEERRDGTYLVFKDPDSGDNRYELLVDEGDETSDSSNNLTEISPTFMPGTFMMEVLESLTDSNESQDWSEIDSNIAEASQSDSGLEEISSCEGPSELEIEIFGHSDSEMSSDNDSMPSLQPCTPLLHSPHPAFPPTSTTEHSPPVKSPICPTCEVLINAGLFRNVNDWRTELADFSVDANHLLSEITHSHPASGLNDVTVHTFYTSFVSLQNYEIIEHPVEAPHATYIPLLVADPLQFASLYPSPHLSSAEARSCMQGFLVMHPELLWLGMHFRLTPLAFVERINALIDMHRYRIGLPTTAGPILGNTECGLAQEEFPTGVFDLRRIGTNPNLFLQLIRDHITGSLTDHDICLISLYFQLRPQLIPHAIFTQQDPIQFIHSILCLLRHLPEFSLVFTGHLPLPGLLFNVSLAPILSTAMSDGHGSFALPRTYSPIYSPSSSLPAPPSSPNVEWTVEELQYPTEPYNSTGHYRMHTHYDANRIVTDSTTDFGPSRDAPVAGDAPSRYTSRRLDDLLSVPPPPASLLLSTTPVSLPAMHTLIVPNMARKPAAGSCYGCGEPAHIATKCRNNNGLRPGTAIPRIPKRRRELSNSPTPIEYTPTIDPALTTPALVSPPPVPPRPRTSILWDLPVRIKSTTLETVLQAAQMICDLSATHTEPYPAYDPRLRQREDARRDDNRVHSSIERYYNDDREAALPKILISLLEGQVQSEATLHEAGTILPGTALYLEYLRVLTLPADLADLDRISVHPHADWEPFIAIGYEILSWHINSATVRELRLLNPTPIHLEIIPHSTSYRLHPNDLQVRFYAAIRQEIEIVLRGVVSLCAVSLDYYNPATAQYRAQRDIRKCWVETSRLPRTYLVTPVPSLPLMCPNDRVAIDSLHHPLMHQFEVDFLRRASTELKRARHNHAYRELARLIKLFTRMDSPYQETLSRMFLSRIFEQTGEIEIYAPEDFHPTTPESSRPVTPDEYYENNSN
ncbi:hypothetical protein DFH09DRAFT_1340648 [Mycena vulgaris]|nr:hypothetical protein DFH09DRAFT_1340648 [Mycena vulgaris]